jgi:hypothetical protein
MRAYCFERLVRRNLCGPSLVVSSVWCSYRWTARTQDILTGQLIPVPVEQTRHSLKWPSVTHWLYFHCVFIHMKSVKSKKAMLERASVDQHSALDRQLYVIYCVCLQRYVQYVSPWAQAPSRKSLTQHGQSVAAIQLYSYTDIQLYGYTDIQLYSYTNIQIYRYTAILIYTYAAIQLYRYTAIKL